MTIIGVYLPSTDHQIEEFESHLQQLEHTIIAYNQLRTVMVAGDFNAHIGSPSELGSSTNIQGQLLIQLMDRCSLYPVTLSSLTKGPRYTFFRDNTKSLIDLVLLSAAHASRAVRDSATSPMHSTHQTTSQSRLSPNGQQKGMMHLCLHRNKLDKSDRGRSDKGVCKDIIHPLIAIPYPSMKALEAEICAVAPKITAASSYCLPHTGLKKSITNKLYTGIKEEALQSICQEQRKVRKRWSDTGKPIHSKNTWITSTTF